jgi:APA family basic amino acid/polyamine antiporter
MENSGHNAPKLARTMGLGALVIYGVGDMLGAGVYGLMGKYAGKMGNAIWLAFAMSMIAALFTGLSYASLGSRYPVAAGAAFITHRAFNKVFLSYVIGLTICASGLTSFATQSRAFGGYLLGFMGYQLPGGKLDLPEAQHLVVVALSVGFILFLTVINLRGMKEATWTNALCTGIEVGGLLLIVAVGARYIGSVNLLEVPASATSTEGVSFPSLGALGVGTLALQGAILTFYSFIGFEDMINVAEEVKDPERNFPRAVVLALVITAVIYALVAMVVVSVVPWRELTTSNEPMVEVMRRAAPWFPTKIFSFVAMFAIANTALLNYIMGSRLVYGMAKQGFLPRALGEVHPTRLTPHRAIFVLMLVTIALALAGDISALASATSTLLLFIFIVVNASLLVLQRRAGEAKGFFEVPAFVPIGGILVSMLMLGAAALDKDRRPSFTIALFLVAVASALFFLMRPKNVTEDTLAELG